jgi:hypothetical protein
MLFSSVTAAIKNLTISGVTIKDYNGIAASWQSTPNVLYPNPEGFMTNFSLNYPTINRGAGAMVDISYDLNYRFLGTQVGNLGSLPVAYGDMVNKVLLIISALISEDAPYSGKVEMEVVPPISFGARADPAGNMYHGADITVRITEMQNV